MKNSNTFKLSNTTVELFQANDNNTYAAVAAACIEANEAEVTITVMMNEIRKVSNVKIGQKALQAGFAYAKSGDASHEMTKQAIEDADRADRADKVLARAKAKETAKAEKEAKAKEEQDAHDAAVIAAYVEKNMTPIQKAEKAVDTAKANHDATLANLEQAKRAEHDANEELTLAVNALALLNTRSLENVG